MTDGDRAVVSHELMSQMWSALGGERDALDRVEFVGEGALPSMFAVSDLAAAVFGLGGAAVGELLATGGEAPPAVVVDRVLSSGWFHLPPGPSRLLSPTPSASKNPWMTEFATADGRWLRVQCYTPTFRRRLAAALDVDEDVEQVAAVVRRHDGDEIEQRLVEGKAAAAVNRTIDEWLAHPAGAAVNAEPLASVVEHAPGASSSPWRPTPGRPLAGVRVLDLTRVAAGPLGTRLLAACGAEVLRLDPPGSDESVGEIGRGNDLMLGKRWAILDLRTDAGLDRFKRLLAAADVLVHGYRPGGLDEIIDEPTRREIKPDLVEVAFRAYGWSGPWQMRRGFDSLVQWSTGLADATQSWALQDPERRLPLTALGRVVDASRPRHLPVEALDITTGYQLAAAAIRGLARRIRTGTGSTTRLSLARTASLLIDGPRPVDDQPVIRLPLEGPFGDRVYTSPRGPVRRMPFPLEIAGNPLFWERPYEAAGSSTPQWTF